MKIIVPSVEIMRTGLEKDFMTPEQFIEKVGRTCYKSEDKITDDSAAKFVSNLIKRGHEAMIEHWNLIYRFTNYSEFMNFVESRVSIEQSTGIMFRLRLTDREDDGGNRYYYVSGNMRAWRDYIKAWLDTAGFIPHALARPIQDYPIFFPEYQDRVRTFKNHVLLPVSVSDLDYEERKVHQTVTMKFVCDRGVSHEIVRHRVASFAQESTRYCNYSQDKFGSEITVIRPSWCAEGDAAYNTWTKACDRAESAYFDMLLEGATPQEARSVLPNSLKTEIIVTMNLNDWNHFFELRCALSAHPDMREVAEMASGLLDGELYGV
jgi:thymidylate synthase (FAD)